MEFIIEPQPLINENPDTGGVYKNAKKFQVGSGSTQFNAGKEGIFLGADNPTDAPFSVDMNGNMTAEAGTFSGKIEIKEGANTVILIDPNG